LDIREDYSTAAQRFFALSRLFMCHHPVIGAAHVARSLGDYLPYRPGWNLRSDMRGERYVWIGAKEEDGRTTSERPEGVPDSEIYRTPPEPPFFGSDAHGFFNRAVSALAVQLAGDERQTEVFRIHHDVLRAARVDLSQLDEWSSQIARSMKERIHEALAGPPFFVSGLVDPAKELVGQYLAFSVPGNVARAVLKSYFVFLIDMFLSPSVMLGPPIHRNPAAFEARRVNRLVSLFLHLRERAAALLIERKAYNLPSFYEMTYLSILLGDVGLMLGRMLLDQVRVTGELRTRILRNQKMLDEELTYSAVPTFLYPALFCEFVVPGELRITRKTPLPEPFVYPQLDGTDATPGDPVHVFRMLLEKTAELPTYNVIGSLDENNRLLDEQNVRELTESLLFLALGQGHHGSPGEVKGGP
jgi:hypothetical protein